jgi:hypothetical protein
VILLAMLLIVLGGVLVLLALLSGNPLPISL